jgi:CYTH domain-containing protein
MDRREPHGDGAMSATPLEIERVWVLRRAPVVPQGATLWTIEQGYLPEHAADDPDFAEGRLRRIEHPDGRVECLHTVKRGAGLVRQETERTISAQDFQAQWPRTQGRRVRKRRHRVREGALVWEVDEFLDWPLWMAEVELPTAGTEAAIPAWLAPVLGAEVTQDPRWRNFALAMHGPPGVSG